MSEARGRVLIVDDDLAVRESLEALLEEDFEVDCAPDATRAEKLLAEKGYEVVLTDFEMPGRNGVEFLRAIQQSHPGVMGILITGHSDHPTVVAASKANHVARVIEKPYDPARLIRWIENVMKLARMKEAMQAITVRRASREGSRGR